MKLIKAHIENFGKISDETFEFNSSLNEFYKENGWGKSTLASFIKVMLFGFDNERARDELSNERKRYKPWQGGTYGGSLEIETKGKKYIISRNFGSKDKEDEFVLRDADTMLLSNDFTKNIGEELFEIDLASFTRTIFISQNDIYTQANGSINAKIGNLTDNTDDINNFETVDKKLADILNAMSPTRKTGSIAKLVDELNDLKIEVKTATALDEAIDKCVKAKEEEKDKYILLKEKQQKLLEKKKEISKYKDLSNLQNEYIRLSNIVLDLKDKLSDIKCNLPEKHLTTNTVDDVLKNIDELKKYESYRDVYCLNDDEILEYRELKDIFKDKTAVCNIADDEAATDKTAVEEISEEIFDKYIAVAEDLIQLEKSMDATNVTDKELEEYELLKEKLGEKNIDEHTIDLKLSNWTRKNEIKSAIKIKELNYQTQKSSIDKDMEDLKRKSAKKNYFPLIAALVCFVAGMALLPVNIYFTIALIVVSIAGAGGFVFINNKNKNKIEMLTKNYESNYDLLEDIKKEIDSDHCFIEKNEREMKEFFSLFSMDYEEDEVIEQLFNLKQSISRYKQLIGKIQNIDKSINVKIDENKQKLKKFISLFENGSNINDSYRYKQFIVDLKNKYIQYEKYNDQISKYNESVNKCNDIQQYIDEFFEDYHIEKSDDITKQLLDLNINVRKYKDIFVEYDHAKQNLSEYIEKNSITDDIINLKPKESEDNLLDIDKQAEDVIKEIEDINNSLISYNNSLNELREKRDAISEKEEYIEQLEEKIAEDKKKYKLIKKTKELLEISKNNLTSKYMKPILDSFTKYYQIISDDITEKFSIDAKINITANEGGIPRRVDLLSEGTKDLVYICMRLALVDAMYTEEKPFILLDDPFVNFDDEKVSGSIKLLQEVSKEYQVIYFTCHNSRK